MTTFLSNAFQIRVGEVTDATLDLATVQNTCPGNGLDANGSDNWVVTWSDDGHQYSSWGDGEGFGGGSSGPDRVGFGIARIEGDINNFSGFNVNGGENAENPGSFPGDNDGKCYGIIAIGSQLYLWRHGDGSTTDAYKFEQLWRSNNHGATWTQVPGVEWLKSTPPDKLFTQSSFIQYGQAYTGIPSHALGPGSTPYVYSVAQDEEPGDPWGVQTPGNMTLMRVLQDQIEVKASYEWFAGFSGPNPTWTSDYSVRDHIIIDNTNGVGLPSCVYNPVLQQYILIMAQDSIFTNQNAKFTMWRADFPWGPWTRFLFELSDDGSWCQNAGGPNPAALAIGNFAFFWNISQKWSWKTPQGTDMVLMGTLPGQDEFGVVEGTLTIT